MFLLVFLTFTKPILLKYRPGMFSFRFDPLNISFCLMATGISLAFIGAGFSSLNKKMSFSGLPCIVFMLFAAVGSMISTDLYGFMLFYEAAFASFFILASGGEKKDPFSLFDHVVYFGPTALFACAALWSAMTGGAPGEIASLPMNHVLRTILAIAFFLRLFLLPFSLSLQRLSKMLSDPLIGCGIVIASVVVWSALIRFSRADAVFAFSMAVIAVLTITILVIQVYRERTIDGAIIITYALQSGFVMGLIGLSGLGGFASAALCWIVPNHILSGAGLLLWSITDRYPRGRADNLVCAALLLCLIGLFPCPGLIGRWMFMESCFSGGAISSFLLPSFLLLVSLSPLYPLARWSGMLKTADSDKVFPMSVSSRIFVFAVALVCVGPLFFFNSLNRFFVSLVK